MSSPSSKSRIWSGALARGGPWMVLIAVCGTLAAVALDLRWTPAIAALLMLGIWGRTGAGSRQVTSITIDAEAAVRQAWDRLDADLRVAAVDTAQQHYVLERYLAAVARAGQRHPAGHPERALQLALAAQAHHQLGEIEIAAMLGCDLVESLPGAPLPLQLQAFCVLATIERDGGAPFGRTGIYPWVRDRIVGEPAVSRAHWALTGGELAEEVGSLEQAAHRYAEALELVGTAGEGSPYRDRTEPSSPGDLLELELDARTALGRVLVGLGAFEAAYEVERDLEARDLDPQSHRWIRRRMAHHAHNLGRFDEARRRLATLIDAAADDQERGRLLVALAEVERDAGRVDDAHRAATLGYLAHAVHGAPVPVQTVTTLATLELERGHPEIAASLVQEVGFEAAPLPAFTELRARLAAEQGHLELAEVRARDAVAQALHVFGAGHPFATDALHTLGKILLVAGKRDQADAVLGRAVSIVEERLGRQHPRLNKLLDALGACRA